MSAAHSSWHERYFRENICLTDSARSGLQVFACYGAGFLSIVYLFKRFLSNDSCALRDKR